MRCLTGREWGASCSALKTIYVALIRSVLDYGSVAYGSAAKSLLKKLDRIQAQALRVCSGAFKTSPVPALHLINKDYKEFVHVYTDGSKKPETGVIGYGVAIPAKGIGINRF